MNIISQILARADYLRNNRHPRTLDLKPNCNLPPVERYLQSQLLITIDEFARIALMIDTIGPEPGLLQAWSEGQTASFTHIISQVTFTSVTRTIANS